MNKSSNSVRCNVSARAIAIAAVLGSAPAFAQDAGATRAGIEEIVVTAQYREQSVEDVPISMEVMSGKELEAAGITDLRGLTQLAPDFFAVEDQNITKVSLRGVSTLDNGEATDQSLVINVDGEYISRGRLLNTSMYDLERVEILRGPQGTLYGRNTTAGAINLVTRKPTVDELDGYLSVDGGNFENLDVAGAINLPLGDTMALRIAATSNSNEGYNAHPNYDENSGEKSTVAGRIGFLMNPTDALSIYLAAELANQDSNSNTFASIDYNTPQYTADSAGNGTCSSAGWETYAQVNGGYACVPQHTDYQDTVDRDNYEGPITGTLGSFESDQVAFRAEVTYDLGAALLTYRGGYRDSETDLEDALPDYIFYRNEDVETFSNELRLSGETDGGLFWQTGLFYWSEKLDGNGGLYSPFINFLPGQNGSWINTFYRPVDSESKAVFGQVEIPFGDAFTAVLGARYTDDNKSATYSNFFFGPNFADPPELRPIEDAPQVIPLEYDHGESTWTVGLNWEPTDATLVFGKVSKGYKAGGFDSAGNFDPETVIAYEFGTKNNFDRYSLTATGFFYDYEDLQASVLIDTTQGGQVFNAGAVTIWGIESVFDTWLSENDRLSLTANYLNAEYDQFIASIPVQCINCDPDLNALPGEVSGNTPPYSPEWILSLGYQHIWDFSGGATLTGGIFSRYKDDYYNTIYNYDDGRQDPYTQTDATLEFVSANGHWSAQAYVRNIEDERPITFATFISAGPSDAFNYSFGPPRTYGVKLQYDF